MLVRLGFARKGRVVMVPTVAVLIAMLGATGLLVGGAAAVMILLRGTEFHPSDVAPLVAMFGFFGFMSIVMSVAGGMAMRSGRLAVWVDEARLRWRQGDESGSVPTEHAELVVEQHGIGKYQHFNLVLLGGAERLELAGSVLESLAKARARRFRRCLGISLPE